MKVYSALEFIDYEGSALLGVFASRDEAVTFIKQQDGYKSKWSGYSFGVIESSLGEAIDVYSSVEYVE